MDSTLKEKGYFIVFEGTEGVGKSTQIRLLARWLEIRGFKACITREPGGTPLSSRIRSILLDPDSKMPDNAELLLYLADRAVHVNDIIRPALESGMIVLCDRYEASTFAYQCGGRGLSRDTFDYINSFARGPTIPNITIWLDMDPLQGIVRARMRSEGALDRLEMEEIAFHQRVRAGYAEYFEQHDPLVIRIPANQTEEKVHEDILAGLSSKMSLLV